MEDIKLSESSSYEHTFSVLRNSLVGINYRLDITERNISNFKT